MIYEFPLGSEPLRQGDIFAALPRIDFTLDDLPIQDEEGNFIHEHWQQLCSHTNGDKVLVGIRPVTAILITQDCDIIRAPDLTFCEIHRFVDVEGKAKQTTSPKSWVSLITQHARINLKWFYLPPDPQIGFTEKMAVDFMVTLRVPREDVEKLMSLRKAGSTKSPTSIFVNVSPNFSDAMLTMNGILSIKKSLPLIAKRRVISNHSRGKHENHPPRF